MIVEDYHIKNFMTQQSQDMHIHDIKYACVRMLDSSIHECHFLLQT